MRVLRWEPILPQMRTGHCRIVHIFIVCCHCKEECNGPVVFQASQSNHHLIEEPQEASIEPSVSLETMNCELWPVLHSYLKPGIGTFGSS